MKDINRWQIECHHTPETIDRILLPIRKRGISVISLNYKKENEESATCVIEFESDNGDTERIFKNMQRIYDIKNVNKLN